MKKFSMLVTALALAGASSAVPGCAHNADIKDRPADRCGPPR